MYKLVPLLSLLATPVLAETHVKDYPYLTVESPEFHVKDNPYLTVEQYVEDYCTWEHMFYDVADARGISYDRTDPDMEDHIRHDFHLFYEMARAQVVGERPERIDCISRQN